MKLLLLLFSFQLLLGCAKPSSDSSAEKKDVLSDFRKSKATWEETKNSISLYEIEYSGCGMTECTQAIVLFDARTNSAISCVEKKRDFDSADFVVSDCINDPYYLKTVDAYFNEFESIMLSGPIEQYTFDPAYGVPVLVVGAKVSNMADAGAPGFSIKFTAH